MYIYTVITVQIAKQPRINSLEILPGEKIYILIFFWKISR